MIAINQLSKRERILFFLTASVVVLAAVINFVVLPLANRWHRLNTQVLALNAKLNRYSIILAQEKGIENRYRLYADYLKARGSSEEAQAFVLQEVEGLAKVAGVVLTNLVPSRPEYKDFYHRFELRIDLEANIISLSRFLYEIQKSRQLFQVNRLNITAKAGSPDLLRCSLQLSKIFIP